MAKPYREGKTWSVRLRVQGQDIYLCGFPTEAAARKAAVDQVYLIQNAGKPAMQGPRQTTLAVAFKHYALERLPYLKGASHDKGRINRYLRLAGRQVVHLESLKDKLTGRHGHSLFWKVSLADEPSQRIVPNSLKEHRTALQVKSAKSDKIRKRLANLPVADVTPYHLQELIDAMLEEGVKPATIELERSELRRLFNHARKCWLWPQPTINPASSVKMPPIRNERDRIISIKEWNRILPALGRYRNKSAIPALSLLLETAMRVSEPLLQATWKDVDWERSLIHLQDAKAGPRAVPLGPGAFSILKNLKQRHGENDPNDPILSISYEALKKAWRVACKEAGVENATIHDLRHTATTRYAIEFNGNLPEIRVITGHKTLSQLMRYINYTPEQVARRMHGKPLDEDMAPAGLSLKKEPQPAMSVPNRDAQRSAITEILPANVLPFPLRKVCA